MAPILLLFFLSSLLIPSGTESLQPRPYLIQLQQIQHQQQKQQAFTSIFISQNGIDFLKNYLVGKAISSIVPLKLPIIERTAKIPFLGSVRMVLSNITIDNINVPSSFVKLGDTGVAVISSGTTCNLTMNWFYDYSTWVLPVDISDSGHASVQVEGMELGLTVGLQNQEGSLKLSLMDCGCYVRDIFINLEGGTSWLYQGMIDAFEDQIRSTVENTITKKLGEGILKLDSFMQALPKEIPVDDYASINVTFVNDPFLSNYSIAFDINGLFAARKKDPISIYYHQSLQPPISCIDSSKMLGISLDQAVFESASSLYYDANFMQWVVDKIPDQSLLNTAGWRFIIPQLYKKYPNNDMNLNVSLSSPPVIKILEHGIDATVYANLILDVLQEDQVIPVACISLVIGVSGSIKISGNKFGGNVQLNDFSLSLEWSKIGRLRLYLIQPVLWTIIQTVFLPYVNAHLGQGFPLPIVHGFTLQNAESVFSSSKITICGDVEVTA
ncbi:hypothetical protein K2173_018808 [Erythroxylum novogranatense]|uniref:Lipid-binding serum glycoprotein C-terminal domain-containing protein n=1 Tax=Erythroxylum novogranatense TaxID=1862640 RepID=A0AAV8SBA0_9ROSI|nr:hypothetical protein K2173_018808 [Erythroxylum novogranatense]